jgi:hypothetical protein
LTLKGSEPVGELKRQMKSDQGNVSLVFWNLWGGGGEGNTDLGHDDEFFKV